MTDEPLSRAAGRALIAEADRWGRIYVKVCDELEIVTAERDLLLRDQPAGVKHFRQRALTAEARVKALAAIRSLVDEQAEDEALWTLNLDGTLPISSEAYLQQELRRLHAAIEALDGTAE